MRKNSDFAQIRPVRQNQEVHEEVDEEQWPDWWEKARAALQGNRVIQLSYMTPVWRRIEDVPIPTISARAWCVLDGVTGRMIWGKNEHTRREIASLTKIMTALITINLADRLDIDPYQTYVECSSYATSINGTSAELKENDTLTLNDLLHGLMLPSGNDASLVLAENFGVYMYFTSKEFILKYGNQDNLGNLKVINPGTHFVKEMNDHANRLGLQNTYFSNPHGLTNRMARSSAFDIAKLSYFAMKNPYFQQIVNTKTYSCKILNNGQWRTQTWENTNRLLHHGFQGVKTGNTAEAGPCLSSFFKTRNSQYITVILNCSSKEERWTDTCKLVNWITQIYEN